jgi:hypothetical protein
MVRKFRQIKNAPDGYEQIMKELGIKKIFYNGSRLAKTYGGCIGVMTIDDGMNPAEPLDINKIRKDGLLDIKLYEKPLIEAYNDETYQTRFTNDYTHYRINTDTPIEIHRSRCLEFYGDNTTSTYSSMQQDFLGNSVIYKLYDILVADSSISDVLANLPIRLNQMVVKTKLGNLNNRDEEEKLFNRINTLLTGLSMHKVLVADKDKEEIDRVQLDSTSVTEIDKSVAQRASRILKIPQLVLLGTTPTGLSSNDESGLTLFYDKIESMQVDEFDENINKIDIVASKAFFNRTEPINYEWIPLYHKSQKAQAETEKIHIENAGALNLMFSDALAIEFLKKKGVFDDDLYQMALKESAIDTGEDDYES